MQSSISIERVSDNRRQNRQFADTTRGLDRDQKRRLHDDITGRKYNYGDIVEEVLSFKRK